MEEVVSSPVECRYCLRRFPVRDLPDHLEACAQREHATQERFE